MSSELTILTYYTLVVILTIVARGVVAAVVAMLGRKAWPWILRMAGRLDGLMLDSVVAMALLVPSLLILAQADRLGGLSLVVVQIFFGARVIYTAIRLLGIPWIGVIFRGLGFLALVELAMMAW